MITNKLLLLSASMIAILVSSTVFISIPAVPRASAQAQLPKEQRNWEYINHNSLGTNYSPQTQINKDNVQNLELKWLFPIPAAKDASGLFGITPTGSIEGSRIPPLVVDGIVYVMAGYRTIFALDASTGKTIWTYKDTYNETAFLKTVSTVGPASHSQGHAIYYFEGRIWISGFGCRIQGIDALTGKLTYEIKDLCVDIPTNIGIYKQAGSHPAVLYKKGNVLIYSMAGEGEGRGSGRMYIAGWDFTTKKLLWRTFLQPPSSNCSGGYAGSPAGQYKCTPLFAAERATWNDWLIKNCDRGWIGGISACDVPKEILANDWGEMAYFGRYSNTPPPPNSGLSNIWGQVVVDEEIGLAYFGTSQPGGTDSNATFRPGPNLFSNSIVALNAMTGEIKWYYQTTSHDLWDLDCSWDTVLGNIGNRKVIFKGCKDGHVHALDALTGKPIWVNEIPAARYNAAVCNAACNNLDGIDGPKDFGRGLLNVDGKHYTSLLDPRNPQDMNKPWDNYPSLQSHWVLPNPGTGAIESDIAFDGKRIYTVVKNDPTWRVGRTGGPQPFAPQNNSTVNALDAATGKVLWTYLMPTVAFRGGVFVSGGVAYWNGFDGILYGADAETGKILLQKQLGTTGLDTQPTMGATADGKMRLYMVFGGRGTGLSGPIPGALLVLGLPDKLPEPQVITKEVIKEVPKEVIKEVVKEVPKEVVKEVIKEVPKEVIKEVPKEVVRTETKTVTVETISPVSYAAIGVSVVILVVAGVLFSRRKKT